jgi:hypothetical protein
MRVPCILSRLKPALLVGCLAAATACTDAWASGFHSRPQVAFASFLGGSSAEGCEFTRGPDGSLYATCGTESPDLPRIGGLQSYQGLEDGYIAKLDPSGRRIIYATYLGSPGQDEIDHLAVDARGHLYVSGFAGAGFPTTPGAFDRTFNGASDCCDGLLGDAFVAKLSADGSRLLYSSFVGGSAADRTSTLALSPDGSVTITGFTGSSNFPTTQGAVRPAFGGGTATFEGVPVDAFAARLDPSGSRLVYSTYLGGSGDDVGNNVALDDDGNAYYTGFSESPDFPTTPGSLKPSYGTPAPVLNGYVTKLDRGGQLVWSTYLGGPARDSPWGIDVDARHDVYVSGSSIGEFPVTAGVAQPKFGGVRDWFVAKLDRSGSALHWATYLGGSDFDGLSPMLQVDRHGHADVVGATASTDFPTTHDAFQPANAGALDLGIAQFDRRGRLRFSSYFGGSGEDDNNGTAPTLDSRGNFYIGGVTNSTDLPVTRGAFQSTYGGGDIDSLLVQVALTR